MNRILSLLLLVFLPAIAFSAQPTPGMVLGVIGAEDHAALAPGDIVSDPPHVAAMQIGPEETKWFVNPDGSCVQCSAGMVGTQNNLPAWTFLLWDTDYGNAERGGSWPGRVTEYARKRNMRLYNVTGRTMEDMKPWFEWAAKTNRYAAMGAAPVHFQTYYGRDWDKNQYYVCNNNSTHKVDTYTPAGFQQLHMSSGPWLFVPDEPSSAPPPILVKWWE